MKIRFVYLVVFILVLNLALAQSPEKSSDELGKELGLSSNTNPDTLTYKLHSFFDSLGYSLTFDKASKAKKGLKITQRHIWEVKLFSEKDEFDKLKKAQEKHSLWVSRTRRDIDELGSEDVEAELEGSVELAAELEKDGQLIDSIKNDIHSSESLSESEKDEVQTIVNSMERETNGVKEAVGYRKEKGAIKFKAKYSLKEDEVKEEVKKLEKKSGLNPKLTNEKKGGKGPSGAVLGIELVKEKREESEALPAIEEPP